MRRDLRYSETRHLRDGADVHRYRTPIPALPRLMAGLV